MMKKSVSQSWVGFLISALMLVFCLNVNALAETSFLHDYSPPKVKITQHPNAFSSEGVEQIINAQISDKSGVKKAILFYRVKGSTSKVYSQIEMIEQTSPINQYHAVIPAADIQAPGIEYYIHAEDSNGISNDYGNIQNWSFSVLASKSAIQQKKGFFKKNKTLLIVGAVLGVVVIASLAGGGDDASCDSASGDCDTIPVRIVAELP